MTVEVFLNKFWSYYLLLEDKFEQSIRYVELDVDNYATYSIDFVNQIQAIGSEIDVIMKVMSGFAHTDRKCITDYATVILNNYPDIVNWEVRSRDILHKPFEGWTQANASSSLPWWEAYNAVKHGRDGNFKQANLGNVVKALMGLYLLEMLFFKRLTNQENLPDILKRESNIFSIVGWQNEYISGRDTVLKVTGKTLQINSVSR